MTCPGASAALAADDAADFFEAAGVGRPGALRIEAARADGEISSTLIFELTGNLHPSRLPEPRAQNEAFWRVSIVLGPKWIVSNSMSVSTWRARKSPLSTPK